MKGADRRPCAARSRQGIPLHAECVPGEHAWAAYAWLTNTVDASEELVWSTILVAMAAMFVAALAVPEAFGRHGVVFGAAFFIVAVMQLTLYALSARGDRDLFQAILRIAPSALTGAALILAAGFVHGGVKPL